MKGGRGIRGMEAKAKWRHSEYTPVGPHGQREEEKGHKEGLER